MAFRDIVGNARVKKILGLALDREQLPNSLLFVGPGSVGKREAALVAAKALNCENLKDDACEECGPCLAISAGRFPDVLVIEPKNDHIGIDDMRFLREAAYLRPMIGKKRVFIVAEAEKMGDEASNSVLKVLEEPPAFSHIILLTSDIHQILPTIRSRCQVMTFSPLDKDEVRAALMERGVTEDKARALALLVRGNLDQALDVDWDEVQVRRLEAWNTLKALRNGYQASEFLRSYALMPRKEARKPLADLFDFLSSFLRDMALLKERGDRRLLFNPDFEPELLKEEPYWSQAGLWKALARVENAQSALGRNVNIKLLVSAFYSHFEGWSHV